MDFQMLPSDVTQLIGSYLLEDKNKTIHKIFHDKKDDDLQVLLFGEVKDLKYIDIDNINNEIYYTSDKMLNYVNNVLQKKSNQTCDRLTINFYEIYSPITIKIFGYNKEGVKIVVIDYFLCEEEKKLSI
jgi:hypothetical protein